MNRLSAEVREHIKAVAIRFLERPYSKEFNCKHFVQAVYKEVGIPYPPLRKNLTVEQLENPPVGYVLFLAHKDPRIRRGRRSTHVAIVFSEEKCIHNSGFFGNQVVITPFVELFELYDLAIPGEQVI